MKIYLGGIPAGWKGRTLKETEKELAQMGAEHRMASFAYRKHAETLIEVSKEQDAEKRSLEKGGSCDDVNSTTTLIKEACNGNDNF